MAVYRTLQFKSQGGHFLEEDISLFDAPFFNISPLEARVWAGPNCAVSFACSSKINKLLPGHGSADAAAAGSRL